MKRPYYILIIVVSTLLWGCTPKPIYTCGLGYLANRPNIDSKVIELNRTGFSNNTGAFISGQIFGKDSTDAIVEIDTLGFAAVYVVDNVTGKTIGNETDMNGNFEFAIPPATYDLKVQYITYNTLIIRDVYFGAGDFIEFKAILGQRGVAMDSTEYRMGQEWTIEKIK